MKKIYKFVLPIERIAKIEMPVDYVPLHVGLDPAGVPCLWALVNPDSQMMPAEFAVVGTGHILPQGAAAYIGTFVHGEFVWHVHTTG